MRPSQTYQVLEELGRSYRVLLRRKGEALSRRDTETVREIYQQWLLLMTDLGYLHPGTLVRDGLRLWLDMSKKDVLDLHNAFAELLQLVRLQSNRGFKGLCRRISSHLYPLVRDDVKLMSLGDVRAAKRLTQAFAFTSRTSLVDLDLTQQMLDAYMDVERMIPPDFPKH